MFNDFIVWADLFLKNLDPSLFQSVILGGLIILVFIGEQIFTEVRVQQERSEFSKMVIFYKILNPIPITVLAIFTLVLFAFFKTELSSYSYSIDLLLKISSLLLFSLFIFLLLRTLFRFHNFFQGERHKFEIAFLKKLCFSKISSFKNKAKSEKMMRAWNSFWSKKSEFSELEFTGIFISHIDDAIKYRKLYTVNQLSKAYVNNIEKRDKDVIAFKILPKVFEWHEQQLLSKQNTEKKNYFLNYYYFSGKFFQKVTETLLKDRNHPYQFFKLFKDYIDKSIEKFNKIKDKEKREEYYREHIHSFFDSFCPTFFNGIKNAPLMYKIQGYLFPPEWKIAIKNTKKGVPNIIPKIILIKFLQWSNERIPINSERINFKKDSEKIIKCIFPSVDPLLFTSFLRLLFLGEIKPALEEDLYFSTLDYPINAFNRERNNEDRQEQIFKMMDKDIEARRKETINIIFTFFSPYWDKLRITLDDNNKDEWNNANNEKKALMLKEARKEKLRKIEEELESEEIRKICENDEVKESDRGIFLILINLLLKEIEKQKS